MTLRQDQQQPLTRRQLREMERAAHGAASGEQQVPAVALPFSSTAVPVPADLRPAPATDASPSSPVHEPAPAPAPIAPVVPLTRRQLRALQQAEEGPSEPIAEAPATPQQAPAQQAPTPSAPIAEVPITALPLPQASAPAAPVISQAPTPEIPAAFAATPEVIDDVPVGPTTGEVHAYQPPTGHWSLGASESSAESSGATTASNALIIPVVPSAADMTGPLNATGEILMTGSIDLPPGLGSTGQVQGRFDGSDIDRLLDQNDRDAAPSSSVSPVAATRAIATHTPSASPNIVPPKKASHRVGAIVGVSIGAVAALGVVGAVVAGFVFHAF